MRFMGAGLTRVTLWSSTAALCMSVRSLGCAWMRKPQTSFSFSARASVVLMQTKLRQMRLIALWSGLPLALCVLTYQTPEDGKMTLRIFGKSDDVLAALIKELGLGAVPSKPPPWPKSSRALVPYNAQGERLQEGDRKWMWLDLSDRAKVRITPGHNIQGAQQPAYMHIGAKKPVTFKGAKRNPGVGNGTVLRRELNHWLLNIEGQSMHLGVWWLVSAINGTVPKLPVVNQQPTFETKT